MCEVKLIGILIIFEHQPLHPHVLFKDIDEHTRRFGFSHQLGICLGNQLLKTKSV